MPELPEVETIRRDLQAKLPGLVIREVEAKLPKRIAPPNLATLLKGAKILGLRRRAKLLAMDVQTKHGEMVVLIHLKMTGQLVFKHKKQIIFGGHPMRGVTDLPNAYSHVVFHFTNGDTLYFNDSRQFGYVKLVEREEAQEIFSHYGVEPQTTAFTFKFFDELLTRKKGLRLKALLLDQLHVAGLGNIYVDEACFRAKVRPGRRAGSLSDIERKALWRSIKQVIALAIKSRGTSFNTYVDTDGQTGGFLKHLKVYGRAKKVCKRCGGTIVRMVVAGRGTHICPQCQK